MTDAATDQCREDDCPLCLEPLPPFWEGNRRLMLMCCEQLICVDCNDKRAAVVQRALQNGTYGKQEEQLARTCPLCRAQTPDYSCSAKAMQETYDNGLLPLRFYHTLGMYYQRGQFGAEQNDEKALEILMVGAEKGDPCCQHAIGNIHRKGTNGVLKSPEEAKRWYLAAIEQGHALAEYQLAEILKEEGDDTEYIRYLSASASKGYDEARFALGYDHYNGDHGLKSSHSEAICVVTPAAERGHGPSMALLGLVLCDGDEDRLTFWENPNFTKGLHWARRAAATGFEPAVSSLGHIEEVASSRCFRCAKKAPPEKAFLRCSRCRAAWYCSKDCQRRHWKAKEGGHKQRCIKWCPQK